MKGDHWHRQTVNDALFSLAQVHRLQEHLPKQIDCSCQVTPPSVKATPLWKVWEQIKIGLPMAQQLALCIPTSALADQRNGDQFVLVQREMEFLDYLKR